MAAEQREPSQTASELHEAGIAAYRRGELNRAIELLLSAAERCPSSRHYTNLGAVCLAAGKLDDAERALCEALAIDDKQAQAHNNLGEVYRAQGHALKAIAQFDAAIARHPQLYQAHCNIGAVYVDIGHINDGLAALKHGLSLNPSYADGYNQLGAAFLQLGKACEAAEAFAKAIQLAPRQALYFNNLGNAFSKLRAAEKATDAYKRALLLDPGYASAHHNLGVLCSDVGRFEDALDHFDRAIAIEPELVDAHCKRGNVLTVLSRFEDAHKSYREALQMAPQMAEVHLCQAMCYLRQGRLEQGFRDYEWRLKRRDYQAPQYDSPPWTGEALPRGTLLLYTEQGYGDTLQFIRYAELAAQRVHCVILQCDASLIALLADVQGLDQVISREDEVPPHQANCSLVSLPSVFSTTLESIPANVPYLIANRHRVAIWADRLQHSRGMKIGIHWQGKHRAERSFDHRTVPLDHFIELSSAVDATLVSLQKGAAAARLGDYGSHRILDFSTILDEGCGRFEDTAALMCSLDLVITSDTSIAHLAGALAVPVWVLLPKNSEWRWLTERSDSPWYPSMYLFRQAVFGDWHDVFSRVFQKLSRWCEQQSNGST